MGSKASAVERIEIRNVNHPDSVTTVEAAKYLAMKRALLAALPRSAPGRTITELKPRVLAKLPEDQCPGGARVGWWLKAVQLDLGARGEVERDGGSPLRFWRT